MKHLGEAGIGGGYWYDNMYHYIKQWDHLKNMSMPYSWWRTSSACRRTSRP